MLSEKEKKLLDIVYSSISRLLNKENWAFYGVIIGSIASGKTTLALTLSSLFTKMFRDSRCYITTDLSYLDPNSINSLEGKYVAIVFDDVSNKIKRFSEHLTKLYSIRHAENSPIKVINKNVFMLFNCHYMRSIAPFLRATPLRILTSISESEIKAYSSEYLFTVSSLWDYLYYYYKYEDRYIILVSVRGKERIIDVTG
jgi:hypothetical protein